ncbi:MAG: pilin [Syntrophaceae bacterium]|nr:pilin [Syntrophaceae bacterium]
MGLEVKNDGDGFTLIELLIVIAIVGILGAAALPYMQGHAIRAKLTEVENAMANVKSAVSAFRQERGTWPDCPTISEVRNSLGIGLESVRRVAELSVTNGIITATIQSINAMVDGKTLILTPSVNPADGSIKWSWGWSSDFPLHLRPVN